MTAQEEGHEVTFHLTDGSSMRVHGPVSNEALTEVYRCLGANEGRVKFPTSPTTVQFLPATSVFRIEATGGFDQP